MFLAPHRTSSAIRFGFVPPAADRTTERPWLAATSATTGTTGNVWNTRLRDSIVFTKISRSNLCALGLTRWQHFVAFDSYDFYRLSKIPTTCIGVFHHTCSAELPLLIYCHFSLYSDWGIWFTGSIQAFWSVPIGGLAVWCDAPRSSRTPHVLQSVELMELIAWLDLNETTGSASEFECRRPTPRTGTASVALLRSRARWWTRRRVARRNPSEMCK